MQPPTSTPRIPNSVDATSGQPIVVRVQARKLELEVLLAMLPHDDHDTRGDIELALGNIKGLLTGDLDKVPAIAASYMNRWLEGSKHLGERA